MVVVLLGEGFEESEAIIPVDVLRRSGIEVKTVSLTEKKSVTSDHGISLEADCLLSDVSVKDTEMVFLPGGLGGVASISACPEALAYIRQVNEEYNFVVAVCAAPTILANLGILNGKRATCHPVVVTKLTGGAIYTDMDVVEDENIVTGRGAGVCFPLAFKMVSLLRGDGNARFTAQSVCCRI